MNKYYFKGVLGGALGAAVAFFTMSMGIFWPASILMGLAAVLGVGLIGGHGKKALELKEDVRRVSMQGRSGIRQINEYIYRVGDADVKRKLKNIGENCNKIIIEINKKPDYAFKTGSFFDYYIPVAVKLVSKYEEIEKSNLRTPETIEFMDSMHKALDDIDRAFDSHLQAMYATGLLDISEEMKVLDSVMKTDGYKSSEDK